jgi:hypothetical protein
MWSKIYGKIEMVVMVRESPKDPRIPTKVKFGSL